MLVFLQFNSRQEDCQVRLCWCTKKKIPGSFNLQELPGKVPETIMHQPGEREQADALRKEALLPVPAVALQDRFDVVLINGKMALHENGKTSVLFIAVQDGDGIRKGDLGIGDDAGRQEGMGGTALPAPDPAYAQTERAATSLDGTQVRAMPDQAGGVSAGTCQLMELEGSDYFIIKILRKGVVKSVSNGYHNTYPGGESRRRFGQERSFGRWGSCLFLCYKKV